MTAKKSIRGISMVDTKEIDDLIEYGYEGDHIDFKAKQYFNNSDLIKDVMAMANSFSTQTKYIICGIKVKAANQKEFIGIEKCEFKDSAEYQQYIYANIEPDLHIEYIPYTYNGIETIRIKQRIVYNTLGLLEPLGKKFKIDKELIYITEQFDHYWDQVSNDIQKTKFPNEMKKYLLNDVAKFRINSKQFFLKLTNNLSRVCLTVSGAFFICPLYIMNQRRKVITKLITDKTKNHR